jgi:hypothetical protein
VGVAVVTLWAQVYEARRVKLVGRSVDVRVWYLTVWPGCNHGVFPVRRGLSLYRHNINENIVFELQVYYTLLPHGSCFLAHSRAFAAWATVAYLLQFQHLFLAGSASCT